MSTRIRREAAAAAAIRLNGRATLFTGTTDDVTFEANLPDVRLSIDGEVHGTLDRAPALVAATTAHAFVRGFDRMLADTSALRSHRLDHRDRSGLLAE